MLSFLLFFCVVITRSAVGLEENTSVDLLSLLFKLVSQTSMVIPGLALDWHSFGLKLLSLNKTILVGFLLLLSFSFFNSESLTLIHRELSF